MNVAFILGRNPTLAQKEIEAAATILPFQWSLHILQPGIVQLKPTDEVEMAKTSKEAVLQLQNRLGGVQKIAQLVEKVTRNDLEAAVTRVVIGDGTTWNGKRSFGVSLYGVGVHTDRLGIAVKKRIGKELGLNVRYILPKEGNMLSSAQVFHNKLAIWSSGSERGNVEVVIIQEGPHFWVGPTLTVQDIDSYAKRDFSLPHPDPVSGMLPPKLAQTMLNLVAKDAKPEGVVIYDPFCGNGRVVSEARLMGFAAYGSDLEEEKVTASQENMTWIAQEYELELERSPETLFWQQDARKPEMVEKIRARALGEDQKLYIASEPYLGRPLRRPLTSSEVPGWRDDLAPLYLDFLSVWSSVGKLVPRMVLIFPRVRVGGAQHFGLYEYLVDRIHQMGYTSSKVSTYERPDAIIARDIVIVEHSSK